VQYINDLLIPLQAFHYEKSLWYIHPRSMRKIPLGTTKISSTSIHKWLLIPLQAINYEKSLWYIHPKSMSDGIFHIKCKTPPNIERFLWEPQKYYQPVYKYDCWSHFRLLTMKSHCDTYIQSLWVLVQVPAKSDGIFHIKCKKNQILKDSFRNHKNIINQLT
jgi:hypothetical protein